MANKFGYASNRNRKTDFMSGRDHAELNGSADTDHEIDIPERKNCKIDWPWYRSERGSFGTKAKEARVGRHDKFGMKWSSGDRYSVQFGC